MNLRLIKGLGSLVALTVLGAGCTEKMEPRAGGQTGHDRTGYECDDKVTVLSSTTSTSSLGFTAADLLAFAQGSFSAPIHWLQPEATTYGPEHGEGEVAVTVSYEGGEVRFVDSEPKDDGTVGDVATLGSPCRDRLEVDVVVHASTAGGALDETFTAALSAIDARYATIGHTIDPATVGGDFTASRADGLTAAGLSIDAGFSAAGTYGTLSGGFVSDPNEDVQQYGMVEYARWPSAASCPTPMDVVVPLEGQFFTFSASEVVALANATTATSSTWKDGTAASIDLELLPSTDIACVHLDIGPDTPSQRVGFTFDAHLHLLSSDGRIDSDLPVVVDATANDEGVLESADALVDAFMLNGVAPADFQAAYGVSGANLGGFDEATVAVKATFVQGGAGGITTGRLSVLGLTVPECVDHPPEQSDGSSGGCQGIDSTEVDWVTW